MHYTISMSYDENSLFTEVKALQIKHETEN